MWNVSNNTIMLIYTIHQQYCEYYGSTFIREHQFLWFLNKALVRGFLDSWFQISEITN